MSLLARDVKETRKHQKSEKISPLEKKLNLETVPLKGQNYFIITVSPGEEAVLINIYTRNIKLWGQGRKENPPSRLVSKHPIQQKTGIQVSISKNKKQRISSLGWHRKKQSICLLPFPSDQVERKKQLTFNKENL